MKVHRQRFTPTPKAIALQYDGMSPPRVTATGAEEIAERIVAIAREHDVPLYEDPSLAGALAHLELGDEIPELLYLAIAEVLAFIYGLQQDGRHQGEYNRDDLNKSRRHRYR